MDSTQNTQHPVSSPALLFCRSVALTRRPRLGRPTARGFTLVELLVVITIIGILASLITVAAVGALKAARRTQIKVEIDQIAGGLDEYKNKTTAYPPNCQTDDDSAATGPEPAGTPLVEAEVLNDVRRHIQQIASKSRESDNLALALVGLPPGSGYTRLERGMSASEAPVFWLGGFSADPKYPISGDGGPSYDITGVAASDKSKADPIESRKWVYPFDVTRLGPRDSNGYFNGRFIEYTDPRDPSRSRRINFWEYHPSRLSEPFVYFDTSRHPVGKVSASNLLGSYDPPAATYSSAGNLGSVYAFKKKADVAVTGAPAIQFINPDKFQVFHCGIDDDWDTTAFKKMAPKVNPNGVNSNNPADYLLFPTGPFVGEFADTQASFAVEKTIEDAQK